MSAFHATNTSALMSWPIGHVVREPARGSLCCQPAGIPSGHSVRSTETPTLVVEDDDDERGRAELERQIPEGTQLIALRVER